MYIHNRLDAADWAMSGVFLSCFLTPQCNIAHQKILKTLAISITHFEMIFSRLMTFKSKLPLPEQTKNIMS